MKPDEHSNLPSQPPFGAGDSFQHDLRLEGVLAGAVEQLRAGLHAMRPRPVVQYLKKSLPSLKGQQALAFVAIPATQHTDCDSRNQHTAPGMETDMSVESKGFSAAQDKAAVRGVSGVQGSPIDHKQSVNCFGVTPRR